MLRDISSVVGVAIAIAVAVGWMVSVITVYIISIQKEFFCRSLSTLNLGILVTTCSRIVIIDCIVAIC